MDSELQKKLNQIPWTKVETGLYQKEVTDGEKSMRMLRIDMAFVEKDWCTKAHAGYVLKGNCRITFENKIVDFQEGDGIWIDEGEKMKHKASNLFSGPCEIVLFDPKMVTNPGK